MAGLDTVKKEAGFPVSFGVNSGTTSLPTSRAPKKQPTAEAAGCFFGGLGGTRTPDALLRTEALYPLSYEAARDQGEYPSPKSPSNAGDQTHRDSLEAEARQDLVQTRHKQPSAIGSGGG